jgi:hypothetical protein
MFDMPWFMGMMRKGYNPEQIMMNVLENRMKGTPMGENLINLARSGNTKEIEKIARNMYGDNFDEQFKKFRSYYGL